MATIARTAAVSTFVAIVLLVRPAPTFGNEVTFQFKGTVTSVADELLSEFAVGESVVGNVSFPARANGAPLSEPGYDFSATFGGDYLVTSPQARIRTTSVEPGLLLNFDVHTSDGIAAPSVNGHVPEYFTFHLIFADNGRWWEVMESLPAQRDLSGLRFDEDDTIQVEYQLEEFFVVPEPTGAPPVSFAIVLMLLLRKRRQ